MDKLGSLISKYDKGEIVLLDLLEEAAKLGDFLSSDTLEYISSKTGISLAKLYGVASFYSFIPTSKKGKYVIRVCNGPSCYLNNSKKIVEILKKDLEIGLGETTKDEKFTLELTSCIGCCDKAPAMLINDKAYTNLDEAKIKSILESLR